MLALGTSAAGAVTLPEQQVPALPPGDTGCRGDYGSSRRGGRRSGPGPRRSRGGGWPPPRPHLVGAEFGPVLAAEAAQEGLWLPAQCLPGAHEVCAAHVQAYPLGGGGRPGRAGRGQRPSGARRRSGRAGAGRPRRPSGPRTGRAAPRRPLRSRRQLGHSSAAQRPRAAITASLLRRFRRTMHFRVHRRLSPGRRRMTLSGGGSL